MLHFSPLLIMLNINSLIMSNYSNNEISIGVVNKFFLIVIELRYDLFWELVFFEMNEVNKLRNKNYENNLAYCLRAFKGTITKRFLNDNIVFIYYQLITIVIIYFE